MAKNFKDQLNKLKETEKQAQKEIIKDTAKGLMDRKTTGEKRAYTKRIQRENKDAVIHVRLTASEYNAIYELAQSQNMSVSQLIRKELKDAVTR